jgi:hypothetical protein
MLMEGEHLEAAAARSSSWISYGDKRIEKARLLKKE